ncbi:ABC transporter ATP-binding protein [Leucobacter sp. BZR 635]|uniref:ABC transporter ATP-binding protein n=1 Tax=Leucobacter sp. BZR 635 TaxID=3378705 RepID=UPI003A83C433
MTLELRGITKRFGSFTANDRISLEVRPGEIHALLGENGAGKSTLMNVLYGLYQPDEGEIVVDGEVMRFRGPGDAMAAGIGMVHQHFMLVPVFSVAENVMLGHEDTKFAGALDLASARAHVRQVADRFGFEVDPDAIVGDLPVGVQQRVEIIKALSRDAKVLVFDEPTAVLTPQETDELMDIMRQLRADGTAIVFITHKLREVREVADRITVIRLGKIVAAASPESSTNELASLMVGRAVELTVQKAAPKLGEGGLKLTDLMIADSTGHVVVDRVNLEVRPGEVVAIAGVQGNGQTELAESLMGLQQVTSGSITLNGESLIGKPVKQIIDAGVGFVPEDRIEDGLVGSFSVAENLILNRTSDAEFVAAGTVRRAALTEFAESKIAEYDIRTQGPHAPVGSLSGGNQQKVVIARELSRDLSLLVASQPTRGVDVGSIEFIHNRIIEARDSGVPVVLVSTELDEVSALADRIAVMYKGTIIGIVPGDAPRETLGLMMAGETPEGDAA